MGRISTETRLIAGLLLATCIGLVTIHVVADGRDTLTPEEAALAACDRFLEAFNTADLDAWAATLHFPHVRLAAGEVIVSRTAEEYRTSFDFNALRRTGWHHSRWDERRVVQASDDKVHLLVRFTRYRADKTKLATYEALYVVTRQGESWGVQCRSTFAPR